MLQPALSLVLEALKQIRDSQEKPLRVSRATLSRLVEPRAGQVADVAAKAAALAQVRERRTAIESFSMATARGGRFATRAASCKCRKRKSVTPAATAATMTIRAVNLRPVLRAILRSMSPSSLIARGVISNAHEQTTAMGRPTIASRTASLTTQFGMLKKGKTCVATWMSNQPVTM